MSCALVLVCTPRNNAEKVKYAQIRRMCYLPVRRPGRTLSNRRRRGTKSEMENEVCTAGTHPNVFPEISTRGVRETTLCFGAISICKFYALAKQKRFVRTTPILKPTNTRPRGKLQA